MTKGEIEEYLLARGWVRDEEYPEMFKDPKYPELCKMAYLTAYATQKIRERDQQIINFLGEIKGEVKEISEDIKKDLSTDPIYAEKPGEHGKEQG